jgi:GTP-binding protein HflX
MIRMAGATLLDCASEGHGSGGRERDTSIGSMPRSSASTEPRDTAADRPRAVLVSVQVPGVSDADHASDIEELGRLVHTLGFEVVATVTQRRDALSAAAVVGEGKLKELAELTGGKGIVPSGAAEIKTKARARWANADAEKDTSATGSDEGDDSSDEAAGDGDVKADGRASVIVVDHEITPSQARNLERATGARVLDRTGVIVDIFHRHARSREARLQVEIARLNYVAPRLREAGGGKERQRGKGAGEAAIELDRRKIRDRIAELREQLAAIQKEQENRRYARRDQLRVALVGYTNAGKSSLMRALTGSQVLVEDKLFATLDTTVRALQPETKPRILVSDTVGFIKKLPHDLVASFRSTLDEALEASLLLYVVDATDPTRDAQLAVTESVLHEIGADAVPSKLLLNKADRLDKDGLQALRAYESRGAIILSAHDPRDISALRETIISFFEASMIEAEIVIPYAKQRLVGEVYECARVVAEDFDETATRLRVRGLPAAIARLKRTLEN